MAGPEAWRFNPSRGVFEFTPPGGSPTEATWSELSGENYELQPNGRLQPTGGGPIYQQGGAGDIVYYRYQNGYGELVSEMLGHPRALYTSEGATYGFQGVLNVSLPNGQRHKVDIAMADLFRRGERIYTYMGDTGEREFVPLVPGSPAYMQVVTNGPADLREATTEETIEYALRGYLATNEQALLAEFAGVGEKDMSDAGRNARYDAARQLAQLSVSGVTLFKTHHVGFSGRSVERG